MIYLNRSILIILVLIFFSDSIYSQNSFFQKSPSRYNYGDSENWKEINFEDSTWPILYSDYIDYQKNYCWIRTDIFLSTNDYDYKDLVLLLDISANYEVYWNGKKLGQNFTGTFDKITKGGIYSKTYSFHDSLEFLSKNKLAIRAHLENAEALEFAYIGIADPLEIKITEYYVFGYLIMLMLIYLVLLYFYITYFKKYNSLLLSSYLAIVIFIMLLSLLIDFLLFAGISGYSFIYLSGNIINILKYLVLFSFSIFFLDFGKVKYCYFYKFLVASILIISFLLELDEIYYISFGFIPPLLIIEFYYEKRSFIKIYSLTFLILVVVFLNSGLNIGIINLPFIIFFFYLSLVYLRNENIKKTEFYLTNLRAIRLETEMLKKIIQPHYIMNSLNSVVEWIEESPGEGLKFIKELSEEFRSFSKFSNKKSISIREELDLCKNHLKIMGYRHHKKYKLDIKLDSFDRQIPPAILHTLVENGINHHPPNSDEICFRFEDLSSDEGFGIKTIVNYCNNCMDCKALTQDVEMGIKNNIKLDNKIIEGNGLKYIRSRLTESFGEKWELNYYGDDTAWITNIKIFSKAH